MDIGSVQDWVTLIGGFIAIIVGLIAIIRYVSNFFQYKKISLQIKTREAGKLWVQSKGTSGSVVNDITLILHFSNSGQRHANISSISYGLLMASGDERCLPEEKSIDIDLKNQNRRIASNDTLDVDWSMRFSQVCRGTRTINEVKWLQAAGPGWVQKLNEDDLTLVNNEINGCSPSISFI